MSQHKSYTGSVGGSIIRRRKLSIACAACGMLQYRLEAARDFLGYPLTGRDSMVCTHAMHGMLVHGTHVPITLLALNIRLHVAVLINKMRDQANKHEVFRAGVRRGRRTPRSTENRGHQRNEDATKRDAATGISWDSDIYVAIHRQVITAHCGLTRLGEERRRVRVD